MRRWGFIRRRIRRGLLGAQIAELLGEELHVLFARVGPPRPRARRGAPERAERIKMLLICKPHCLLRLVGVALIVRGGTCHVSCIRICALIVVFVMFPVSYVYGVRRDVAR